MKNLKTFILSTCATLSCALIMQGSALAAGTNKPDAKTDKHNINCVVLANPVDPIIIGSTIINGKIEANKYIVYCVTRYHSQEDTTQPTLSSGANSSKEDTFQIPRAVVLNGTTYDVVFEIETMFVYSGVVYSYNVHDSIFKYLSGDRENITEKLYIYFGNTEWTPKVIF